MNKIKKFQEQIAKNDEWVKELTAINTNINDDGDYYLDTFEMITDEELLSLLKENFPIYFSEQEDDENPHYLIAKNHEFKELLELTNSFKNL